MELTKTEINNLTKCLENLKPFAIVFTKNYEKAQDLIQDTALKGISNYEKFDKKSNLSSWLYTIMRNIYINNYRRNQLLNNITGKLKEEQKKEIAAMEFKPHSIEKKLNNDMIFGEVEALPFILKSCLKLFINGYSYDEISTILSIPEGTVKSRIHKARKLLKSRLSFLRTSS